MPDQMMSHLKACKEFGLTEGQIISAIRSGKLKYKQLYAHGNPYFSLVRDEVKALAKELHGADEMKEQERKHKLETIDREINSLRRKLTSLEKQKHKLLQDEKS